MALFGLISSDEELSADRARLAASKDFATRSIEDSSKYYMSDEKRHYNPQTEKWEPEAKSSNEEKPKSKTNPNAKTGDATDEVVVTATRKQSFSITQFRSEMEINGVLPVNRFLVLFARPKTLSAIVDTQFLTMRCENASVPGVNFFTSQTNRYGYGQTERRPYLPTFNPITLSFIVDRKSTVIELFNVWTNSIVNHDVSGGMYASNGLGNTPYQLSYKDDYICRQMQIYVYDHANEKQIKVTLYDVYPLATTDVALGWGQNDEVMKYNVSLQYTNMTIEVVVGNALEAEKTTPVFAGMNFATPQNQEVQNARIKEIQSLENKIPNPSLNTTGSNLSGVDAARFTLYNGVPNPTLKI